MISISMVYEDQSSRDARYDVKATPIPRWRWVTLLSVICVVAHERFLSQTDLSSLESHLRAPMSSLAPAPSAFAIWTVIELMVISYALAQLEEDQRRVPVFERANRLLILILLLSSLRLMMVSQHSLWITTGLSGAMAAASLVAYQRVRREIAAQRAARWIGMPFSLLLGWTSIIAIASLDAAITTSGMSGSAPAVLLVGLVAGTALYLGLQQRDYALPGVVAWLLAMICATNRAAAPILTITLLATAMCTVVGIMILATRINRTPPDASPSPSPRSPGA